MPDIEILNYSPNDMDKFIAFCIEGKRKASGEFETDGDDREMRGVMSWLHGREVTEAHFFNTPPDHPMKLFMALVQKNDKEKDDRPWVEPVDTDLPRIILETQIAGIENELRMDGQVGKLTQFLPLSGLLAAVQPNKDLDAAFAAGRKKVQDVLKKLEADPAEKRKFLAALRSDKGSRPTEVFAEIKSKFAVSF